MNWSVHPRWSHHIIPVHGGKRKQRSPCWSEHTLRLSNIDLLTSGSSILRRLFCYFLNQRLMWFFRWMQEHQYPSFFKKSSPLYTHRVIVFYEYGKMDLTTQHKSYKCCVMNSTKTQECDSQHWARVTIKKDPKFDSLSAILSAIYFWFRKNVTSRRLYIPLLSVIQILYTLCKMVPFTDQGPSWVLSFKCISV